MKKNIPYFKSILIPQPPVKISIQTLEWRCAHYKLNITFCASKAIQTESFKQKKLWCLQVNPSQTKQNQIPLFPLCSQESKYIQGYIFFRKDCPIPLYSIGKKFTPNFLKVHPKLQGPISKNDRFHDSQTGIPSCKTRRCNVRSKIRWFTWSAIHITFRI